MKRRKFIAATGIMTAGIAHIPMTSVAGQPQKMASDSSYLIGPQEGFSPEIGTLLSTMTMMRDWVIRTVQDLTVAELDFQIDDQSNSIGAMLLHLAATERFYQLNTFDGLEWGSWPEEIEAEWGVPMRLGEEGREIIKGHPAAYYLEKMKEVRDVTMREFAKRNDDWLFESELFFEQKPTNNYCKWFHVCEHESNHRGQMKFIKKRLPNA